MIHLRCRAMSGNKTVFITHRDAQVADVKTEYKNLNSKLII